SVGTPFVLVRASDYDQPADIPIGSIGFIAAGSQASESFVQVASVATIGTDPIIFQQYSVTYPLSMGNGGTGVSLSPTANNLVYSTASEMALLATANNAVLVTSAAGVPS